MINNMSITPLPRAVGATEKFISDFDSMAEHSHSTMAALRRQSLDRTLKRIEKVSRTIFVYFHFKHCFVIIATNFTFAHRETSLVRVSTRLQLRWHKMF
jgi:hypothetical protein